MRLTVVSVFLASFLLAGCGVKPSAVDPPHKAASQTKGAEAEKDYFPRTYPDPSTDPAPKPNPNRLIR